MSSHCLRCGKNTEIKNSRDSKTNNGKTMMLSKRAICGSRTSIAKNKKQMEY